MTADRAQAHPILAEVARVLRSRPAGAALGDDIDAIVRDHHALCLAALRTSPALRERVRESLGKLAGAPADLAVLLLHPDDAVVAAACRRLAAPPPADRTARRLERATTELKARLRTALGRLDYARDDAERARREAAEAATAAADAEERAAALRDRLALAESRLDDPRAGAAALLRAFPDLDGVLAPVLDPPPPPRAVVRDLDLRVTPLGGDTEIGGSCVLVEAGGTRILIDAGLRPGEEPSGPRDIAALDDPVDAVVVTHAHNDHAGYVPALARVPGLRVLATPETVRLMPAMWTDATKLMERRAARLARYGTDWTPLYGRADVAEALRRCEDTPFGTPRTIGVLTVELFPAGHILGAAGAVITAGDRRVVVTGDISGFRQETVDGYRLPGSARDADLLVLESTCCTDDHDSRDARVTDLIGTVEEIWNGGGRVLIPAFALGRAQEIALILRRHLPSVPVRLDGMAAEISGVFERATAATAHPLTIFGDGVTSAVRPRDLDTFRRGVVITTSGMLTAGPAVQWAGRVLPEPGSALLISGFQDEESPGRALLGLAERGGAFTLPDDRTVPVRARVRTMHLSAHADRHGLITIADEAAARNVMLVHGLPNRQHDFRNVLKARHHHPTRTAAWSP